LSANSLSQHLVVKFSKHLELRDLILGEVRPIVGCRFGGFDLLNPPALGSDVGSKSSPSLALLLEIVS
jgi:hypothetical protein